MLESIKEWVKGLVLLALLASCLEMLLPMGGMKKYVKLTMGLLIVLATLKPLFGFLGQPVAATSQFFEEKAEPGLPALSEIMARATAFREKNQKLAAAEVAHGLAAEAARAARGVTGVADAEAEIDLDASGKEVVIRSVTVRVTAGQPGGVKPVEPVAPVGSTPGGQRPARQMTPEEQRLADGVRKEVAERLGLTGETEKVRVLVGQGQGR